MINQKDDSLLNQSRINGILVAQNILSSYFTDRIIYYFFFNNYYYFNVALLV